MAAAAKQEREQKAQEGTEKFGTHGKRKRADEVDGDNEKVRSIRVECCVTTNPRKAYKDS
jgi:hypothetical protein